MRPRRWERQWRGARALFGTLSGYCRNLRIFEWCRFEALASPDY